MPAFHLIISGRVQGVYFRQSMLMEAQRLGASGWVRNRRDGTVEAVIGGDAVTVQALLGWAHRGPAGASVDAVRTQPAEAPSGAEFEVLRTA